LNWETEKQAIRDTALQQRMGLSYAEIQQISLVLKDRMLKSFHFQGLKVSCFVNIPSKKEVNTIDIIHALCDENQVYLPVCNFSDSSLSHWLFEPGDLLIENRYGIPEPKNQHISLSANLFDVVIVPLLAVDKKGNRIGYGKGFYDRFLSLCNPNVIKIGLNFFEPMDCIPCEARDIPLDYLISPSTCHSFKN